LRRLNQRKEDYLTSLNRTERKSDPFEHSFGHDKGRNISGII